MIKSRKVYDPLTDTWSTGYWVVDDKGNYYPVWQKKKYSFQKGDYMAREICGECKYSKYSTTEKEFYCSNTDSDNYGIPTMYDDTCEDFEKADD